MKNTYWLVSLAASFLFGSAAVAQTQTRPSALHMAASDTIAVSTNASTKTADLAEAVDNPTPNEQPEPENETLAQVARRRPGGLYPRRGGYSGRGYPSVWSSPGNARHTLIGLAIGFGLGAALGAKGNQDPHPGAEVGASVLFGVFGGMIGAAIGHGVPSFYARNGRHHRESWEDEEASNLSPVLSRQTPTSRQKPPAASNAGREDAHPAEAP
jgi:hypothetical protein